MPNIAELTAPFDRLGTPPAGQQLIAKASKRALARKAASQRGNVITILTSQKMSRHIRTENRHIEFAIAVAADHGDGVLKYYAQPFQPKRF